MKPFASTRKDSRAVIMTPRQFLELPRICAYYKLDSSPDSLDGSRVEEQESSSAEDFGSRG